MDGNAGQEENANSLYRASSINGRGDMDNSYDNNNKVLNDALDNDNNEVAIDNNKEKVNDEGEAGIEQQEKEHNNMESESKLPSNNDSDDGDNNNNNNSNNNSSKENSDSSSDNNNNNNNNNSNNNNHNHNDDSNNGENYTNDATDDNKKPANGENDENGEAFLEDEDVDMTDTIDINNRTWRVKLYQLREDDGQWADNGTGHVKWSVGDNEGGASSSQMYGSQSGMIHLVVTDEKPPHGILYEGGFDRDRYSKQGDTIITWQEESQDGNIPADLALSFQDVEGCNEVWHSIQESCRFSSGGLTFSGINSGVDDDMDTQDADGMHSNENNNCLDEIPGNITINDILHVYKLLDRLNVSKGLGTYCTEKNKGFITQLLNCFNKLEEEKVDPDIDKFHLLFHIFKFLLVANAPEILEMLLLDEHWVSFFGVLEYNPDCSVIQHKPGEILVNIMADNGERITGETRYDYRKYLQGKANFKQVAPIQNKQIVKKIHMNFRLEYLLHCVEGVVTEELRQTATSMQIYNNNDIVQMTSNDKVFIAGILASLGSSDAKLELRKYQQVVPSLKFLMPATEPSRVDTLTCLKELCKLATQMQLATRANFYRAFYQEGGFTKGGGVLFDVLADVLGDPKSTVVERQAACEILSFCVQHDTTTLRKHLCLHGEHPSAKPEENMALASKNSSDSQSLLSSSQSQYEFTQSFNEEEEAVSRVETLPLGRRSRGNAVSIDDTGDLDLPTNLSSDDNSNTTTNNQGGSTADELSNNNNNNNENDKNMVVGPQENTNSEGKATGGSKLLQRLCARLTGDNAESIQLQCKGILEFLLDTDTMEPNEKEEFIAIFYDHYIPWLVHALSRCPGPDGSSNKNVSEYNLPGVGHPATPRVGDDAVGFSHNDGSNSNNAMSMTDVKDGLVSDKNNNNDNNSNVINYLGVELSQNSISARASWVNVVDLLSFCVKHHQYRIKSYMLHNNVIAKVLRLLNCREKHVKLTAIRFVRTCIALKDEFYNKKMVKHNLLKPIFKLFIENGPRDNLINSTVIELVDFVTKNQITTLASYIVNEFHVNSNAKNIVEKDVAFDFSKITYVKTFKEILTLINGELSVNTTTSTTVTTTPGNVDDSDSNAMDIEKDNDEEENTEGDKQVTLTGKRARGEEIIDDLSNNASESNNDQAKRQKTSNETQQMAQMIAQNDITKKLLQAGKDLLNQAHDSTK